MTLLSLCMTAVYYSMLQYSTVENATFFSRDYTCHLCKGYSHWTLFGLSELGGQLSIRIHIYIHSFISWHDAAAWCMNMIEYEVQCFLHWSFPNCLGKRTAGAHWNKPPNHCKTPGGPPLSNTCPSHNIVLCLKIPQKSWNSLRPASQAIQAPACESDQQKKTKTKSFVKTHGQCSGPLSGLI